MGGPVDIGPRVMGGPRNPAPLGGPGGNQGLRMGAQEIRGHHVLGAQEIRDHQV